MAVRPIAWPTLVLFVTILLALRRVDLIVDPQFWFEDGRVFYADQVAFGLFGTILRFYAGYLHVIPRMVAFVGSLVPAYDAPGLMSAIATVLDAACVAAFARPEFRAFVKSDVLRVLAVVAYASCLPLGELIGSVANLQWFLSPTLLLVLLLPAPLLDSQRRITTASLAIFALLTAASAPQTVLFLPLAAFRMMRTRGRYRAIVVGYVVGAFAQLAAYAFQPHEPHPSIATTLHGVLLSFGYRAVLGNVVGIAAARELSNGRVVPVAVLASLVALAIVTTIVIRDPRRDRALAVLSTLAISLASIWSAVSLRGLVHDSSLDWKTFDAWNAERYFVLAGVIFVAWCAILADRLPAGRARGALVFSTILALGCTENFGALPFSPEPSGWAEESQVVDAWRVSRSSNSISTVRVLQAPSGWTMRLPPADRD